MMYGGGATLAISALEQSDHAQKINLPSKSTTERGAAALADESQVEERLRALIAMLGKAPNNHNDTTEGYRKEGERNLHSETNSTKAPNRIGFGLEPLMGGNLANDEEGTLQYLSQLETVARRLKDQLLQDQQKVCTRSNR